MCTKYTCTLRYEHIFQNACIDSTHTHKLHFNIAQMVAAERFVLQQLPCPLNVRTLAIRNGTRVRILDEVCDLTQLYVD